MYTTGSTAGRPSPWLMPGLRYSSSSSFFSSYFSTSSPSTSSSTAAAAASAAASDDSSASPEDGTDPSSTTSSSSSSSSASDDTSSSVVSSSSPAAATAWPGGMMLGGQPPAARKKRRRGGSYGRSGTAPDAVGEIGLGESHGEETVMRAMVGNAVITALKGAMYLKTGSSAMGAEFVHSLVDVGNQSILLKGLKEQKKVADSKHEYGYERTVYFYSLVSAMGLFWGGAVINIGLGSYHLIHPPAGDLAHAISGWECWTVLAFSFLIDGYVLYKTFAPMYRHKPEHQSWGAYLDQVKDPMILSVLFEDLAACTGIVICIGGMGLTLLTGSPVYDAAASIMIGILLGRVALYLTNMNKRYLIGEAIDDDTQLEIKNILEQRPGIDRVGSVRTQWLGPTKFSYKADVDFDGTYVTLCSTV